MLLTSPTFENQSFMESKYTCDGKNLSPPLHFEEISSNAQSLVLIVDDPDAPRGDWVHWLLWNISPDTTDIPENSVPPGSIKGTTDFGSTSYGGPCPPSGTHRYFFKLYALDQTLELPPSTQKIELLEAMKGHVLEEAILIGKYERQAH